MSLWIESHTELGSHKKLYKLCKELKIECVQAVGHLHYLWWWTIQNRPDGDLIGLFPVDIAIAGKWSKEPKRFLEALKKAGWIKDMKIVDWQDYVGTLLKARERKKKWKKEHGQERSKNVLVDVPQNVPEQVTEPNRTEPNRTVKEKNPVFSPKDEEIVLQDLAKARQIAPESEAARVALAEIIGEISKVKGVKNALALARHKAINQ